LLIGRRRDRNLFCEKLIEGNFCVGFPARLADQVCVARVARLEPLQDLPSFHGLQTDVQPGQALGQNVASPSAEHIRPGLDRIFVKARLGRGEGRGPAVVAMRPHGNARPLTCTARPPQQFGGQHGMAVAHDVGPDLDRLARDALDRKAPAVDRRINVFDDDPPPGAHAN